MPLLLEWRVPQTKNGVKGEIEQQFRCRALSYYLTSEATIVYKYLGNIWARESEIIIEPCQTLFIADRTLGQLPNQSGGWRNW